MKGASLQCMLDASLKSFFISTSAYTRCPRGHTCTMSLLYYTKNAMVSLIERGHGHDVIRESSLRIEHVRQPVPITKFHQASELRIDIDTLPPS